MEKKENRQAEAQPGQKTVAPANKVSNSVPVQDNSSPDNDRQAGSPRSADESNQQGASSKSNR